MTADMSVAPEIARLAEPVLLVPAQLTIGALAGRLRSIAATPERWWGLVRFDPDRSVKIIIEESVSHQAWLVVLPPGDAGHTCDCDVATMIAGEAAEYTSHTAVLHPGPVRVHGQQHGQQRGQHAQQHGLRGRGAGYSISLHARAHRPATQRQ